MTALLLDVMMVCMSEIVPQNVALPSPLGQNDINAAHKSEIRRLFVQYIALPDPDKCEMLGIPRGEKGVFVELPTQKKFASKYGISERTLNRWKVQAEFVAAVDLKRKEWGMALIPNVLAALYRRCVQYGMAYDVETYLAYFDNWSRTQSVKIKTEKVDADDLRTLIALLPPEKQLHFNELVANLITEAESSRISS